MVAVGEEDWDGGGDRTARAYVAAEDEEVGGQMRVEIKDGHVAVEIGEEDDFGHCDERLYWKGKYWIGTIR